MSCGFDETERRGRRFGSAPLRKYGADHRPGGEVAARESGVKKIRFLAGPRHEDTHRLALKAGEALRLMEVLGRTVRS